MKGTDSSGQRRACVWLLAVSAEGNLQRICPCLAMPGLMLTQCDVARVESGSRGALSVLSALPQQTASDCRAPPHPRDFPPRSRGEETGGVIFFSGWVVVVVVVEVKARGGTCGRMLQWGGNGPLHSHL